MVLAANVIRHRPSLGLAVSFALIAMASDFARGAVPPTSVTQQQDRAVHAYCAEWRRAHGKLNADEMNKRVVTRLQERYPTVFPGCRPDKLENCLGWLNALVEGLRRYGPRSLESVCSSFQDDQAVARLPSLPVAKAAKAGLKAPSALLEYGKTQESR